MKFSSLKNFDPSLELLHGKEGEEVLGICAAHGPVEGKFAFVKNAKFLAKFFSTDSDAQIGLVLSKKFFSELEEATKKELEKKTLWLATTESVDKSMCALSRPFYDQKFSGLNYHVDGRQMGSAEVDPDAEIAQGVFIGENCKIGKGAVIMPGCVVMPNCEVGEGTILFPNVTLYPYSKIGSGCRLHSNVVIGSDGFGYNFIDGEHQKIWHFGGVEIRNNVEIGSGTCVDAGAFEPTFIDDGTKLDNHVQIAHNNKIGKHCVLCGRAGLAGSVTLEDYVVIGAAGGCAPGATLKQGTQVGAMAAVSENAVWGPGETLAGHPARPLKEWLKNQARLRILANKK